MQLHIAAVILHALLGSSRLSFLCVVPQLILFVRQKRTQAGAWNHDGSFEIRREMDFYKQQRRTKPQELTYRTRLDMQVTHSSTPTRLQFDRTTTIRRLTLHVHNMSDAVDSWRRSVSAVFAVGRCPSVCLSVCRSVTYVYCI